MTKKGIDKKKEQLGDLFAVIAIALLVIGLSASWIWSWITAEFSLFIGLTIFWSAVFGIAAAVAWGCLD